MNQRSPSDILQRGIAWVKARLQSADTSSTSSGSGESGGLASVRSMALQVLGHLKGAAGEARTRGKEAFDELQRRRNEQPGTSSSDESPSPKGTAKRPNVSPSASGQTGGEVSTLSSGPTGNDIPAPESAVSSESESSANPSSVAWASTAGVIDTDLTTPSSFIEAEKGSASTAAQQADPDAGPAERAAETDVDVTAQVAGNAEEGTRNEAAANAWRATTNTPRVESLLEAPDDPIGGPEDRTPGTRFATDSTEPYAFGPSDDQESADRDDAPTSGEPSAGSAASDRARPSASTAVTVERRPPSTGENNESNVRTPSSAPSESSARSGMDESSTSASASPAPVGDDGLPIYFDSVGSSGSGTQGGDDAGSGSPSTTLSADAYRSTTAPEEMASGDEGSGGSQRPRAGSTIPDFATDSDSATRVVESRRGTTDSSPSRDRGGSPSTVGHETDDAPPAGVGVTVDEPTGQVPGDFEPGSDPASGQARVGTDTNRRGTAGLGGRAKSSGDRSSFDDVQVSDAAAADPSGEDVTGPNTITQQDTAGAVDTTDPEGISRTIVREANRPGDGGSTPSTPPKGSGGTRRSRSNRRDRSR